MPSVAAATALPAALPCLHRESGPTPARLPCSLSGPPVPFGTTDFEVSSSRASAPGTARLLFPASAPSPRVFHGRPS